MDVVSPSWEPHVRDRRDGTVNRAAYACCVLDRLRVGLRRRDVYAPGSIRWGDPRAELLSPDTWEQQREQACEDLALDTDPAKVVANLGQALDEAWRRAAGGMATNPDLRIEHPPTSASSIVTGPTGSSSPPRRHRRTRLWIRQQVERVWGIWLFVHGVTLREQHEAFPRTPATPRWSSAKRPCCAWWSAGTRRWPCSSPTTGAPPGTARLPATGIWWSRHPRRPHWQRSEKLAELLALTGCQAP
jgi:hypothetical protein